jgi:hypothetical protein
MKQISIESTRVDISKELDLIIFCSIMHCTKVQKLRC